MDTLKDGHVYVVEFLFTGGPHGDVERMVVRYEAGHTPRWRSFNDHGYEDGPIPVEVAGYRVVGEVDFWGGLRGQLTGSLIRA